jgi:hypothetical protein
MGRYNINVVAASILASGHRGRIPAPHGLAAGVSALSPTRRTNINQNYAT